jgi:hypothetical protein
MAAILEDVEKVLYGVETFDDKRLEEYCKKYKLRFLTLPTIYRCAKSRGSMVKYSDFARASFGRSVIKVYRKHNKPFERDGTSVPENDERWKYGPPAKQFKPSRHLLKSRTCTVDVAMWLGEFFSVAVSRAGQMNMSAAQDTLNSAAMAYHFLMTRRISGESEETLGAIRDGIMNALHEYNKAAFPMEVKKGEAAGFDMHEVLNVLWENLPEFTTSYVSAALYCNGALCYNNEPPFTGFLTGLDLTEEDFTKFASIQNKIDDYYGYTTKPCDDQCPEEDDSASHNMHDAKLFLGRLYPLFKLFFPGKTLKKAKAYGLLSSQIHSALMMHSDKAEESTFTHFLYKPAGAIFMTGEGATRHYVAVGKESGRYVLYDSTFRKGEPAEVDHVWDGIPKGGLLCGLVYKAMPLEYKERNGAEKVLAKFVKEGRHMMEVAEPEPEPEPAKTQHAKPASAKRRASVALTDSSKAAKKARVAK